MRNARHKSDKIKVDRIKGVRNDAYHPIGGACLENIGFI
ncbi:hypothetical protein SRABI84_04423 [Peribacillus simplex]|nr:hypothetical protein SRABI84_04423 [Peribacillus simplex]